MDVEMLERLYKGEDIISRMPDDVLSHIISRLEAKDAVKTSVLSSRWKNVWTLIHNFCFNFITYYDEENGITLFVNFVEHVLHRSQSKSIQKFHINTFDDLQESDAARLIEFACWAVDRNVCSLKLNFRLAEGETPTYKLPQSILTCKSLVRLSLGFSDFVLDIPDCTVCFSCLRFLSIYVCHPNGNSLQKLFRSCPILEELEIEGLREYGDGLTFDINMPTLKKLQIHLWSKLLTDRFVVRAGNLEYLDLWDDDLACDLEEETPFLNKVILGNGVIVRLLNEHLEEAWNSMCATKFFRAISSTRFLSLGIDPCVLYTVPCPPLYGNLPLFPNLISLYLGIDIVVGFALLVQFFNNSPNLEVLVLQEEYYFNGEGVVLFELECVPSCMLLHLKEVHLSFTHRNGQEPKVIKWLLENSKVLERFSVHMIWSFEVYRILNLPSASPIVEDYKQEIQNEILNLPRASPICEIEFFNYRCKEKLRSKFRKYR